MVTLITLIISVGGILLAADHTLTNLELNWYFREQTFALIEEEIESNKAKNNETNSKTKQAEFPKKSLLFSDLLNEQQTTYNDDSSIANMTNSLEQNVQNDNSTANELNSLDQIDITKL